MKWSPLLASGLFLVLACLTSLFIFPVTSKDLATYVTLERQSGSTIKSSSDAKSLPFKRQKRSSVTKEICYQQEVPLHFRVLSVDSELFFQEEKGKLEVVEELKDVFGWMQEEQFYVLPNGKEVVLKGGKGLLRGENPELPTSWIALGAAGLKPMQYIRYFEAEKATYHYATQTFLAEEVHLQRYRLAGHCLPTQFPQVSPLMNGVADRVEFYLQGKLFEFRAHHLKAEFE